MVHSYDPASYPCGVPSPYGARVHAWNQGPYAQGTRYHGSVWTRPAYRLPWQARPYAGLGAAESPIPWRCWDAPGFKPCHAEQWQQAYAWCTAPDAGGHPWWESSGATLDECVTANTQQRTLERCVPRYCPGQSADFRQAELVDSSSAILPWLLAGGAGLMLVAVALYSRGR
jgi:hypothetical protein